MSNLNMTIPYVVLVDTRAGVSRSAVEHISPVMAFDEGDDAEDWVMEQLIAADPNYVFVLTLDGFIDMCNNRVFVSMDRYWLGTFIREIE